MISLGMLGKSVRQRADRLVVLGHQVADPTGRRAVPRRRRHRVNRPFAACYVPGSHRARVAGRAAGRCPRRCRSRVAGPARARWWPRPARSAHGSPAHADRGSEKGPGTGCGDSFWQIVKQGTVAQVVRSHREHDVDRALWIAAGLEQKLNEGSCLTEARFAQERLDRLLAIGAGRRNGGSPQTDPRQ